MTFGVIPPSISPYFVLGDFSDFDEKVPDLARRAAISTTFKYGDRLLPPDETPQHLLLKHGGKRLRDIFKTDGGAMVISQTLRNLLEELDPGRHQFLPVSIDNMRDGSVWFILNVHAMQSSIVDDKSEVRQNSGSQNNQTMCIPALDRADDVLNVTFNKANMTGLHIWREQRYGRHLFVSDEFVKNLIDNSIDFFKLSKGKHIYFC